jgi:hypothetical protein
MAKLLFVALLVAVVGMRWYNAIQWQRAFAAVVWSVLVTYAPDGDTTRLCTPVCAALLPQLRARFPEHEWVWIHGRVIGHLGEHDWLAFSRHRLPDALDENTFMHWFATSVHLDPTYSQFMPGEHWSLAKAMQRNLLQYDADLHLSIYYRSVYK